MNTLPISIIIWGISLLLAALQSPLPQSSMSQAAKILLLGLTSLWVMVIFIFNSVGWAPVYKTLPGQVAAKLDAAFRGGGGLTTVTTAFRSPLTLVFQLGGLVSVIGFPEILKTPWSWLPVVWQSGFILAQIFGQLYFWLWLPRDVR